MRIPDVLDLAREAQHPLTEGWLERLNPGHEPYWRFLYLAARRLRPACSVVIGTWKGEDVAHLAAGWPGGRVLGVDLNPREEWNGVLRKVKNASFAVGRAHEVALPKWARGVGLVFQDSSHHYAESMAEWERFSRLLAPGAVWVCDDVALAFHDPEVDREGEGMLEYFYTRPGEKVVVPGLHLGNAVGVVLT